MESVEKILHNNKELNDALAGNSLLKVQVSIMKDMRKYASKACEEQRKICYIKSWNEDALNAPEPELK